jgi:beta-mannanase
MSKLTTFEQRTGRQVEIVHWGQPWMRSSVPQDFPQVEMDQVRQHGSISLLDWGSADRQGGIDQPNWQLHKVAAGQYDSYIKRWATAAKTWGHPFFLRFDHEMNGWWFVWDEQMNGNRPGDYVAAWRHVHDIFTQVGATNVTWVWCVTVFDNPRLTPAAELYPGDAYVDWVAMDGFNWGSDGDYWQTFDEVFGHTYRELTQLAPTKPLMIGEVASSEKGGPLGSPASKAAWIADTFSNQLPFNFPLVKAVIWFDSAGENPEHTWPLESSLAALGAFRQAMAAVPKGE